MLNSYNIAIQYKRKNSHLNQFEINSDKPLKAHIIDGLVLEKIMKREIPNLLSIYPLLKTLPVGSPGQLAPTHKELMKNYKIEFLHYNINNQIFCITTC